MSKPSDPIKRIEDLAAAHPDAKAELAGGLVHIAGGDPLGYDTSDYLRYAQQVSEDALVGRHEDDVQEELARISRLFPGKPVPREQRMRFLVVLAWTLMATPVAALDVQEMDRWSAEAHVLKGQMSFDTILVFRKTSPGTWKVQADCQTTDVRTKQWKSHKASGTARLREGFVVGELGQLGRVVVAADRISIDDNRCASGEVVLGTGD
jgi:hypothetical protein